MTQPAPDGIPLWLRIVLGAVPLAAALIAGVFLLANTIGRRIERLKNLADIRDKVPSWMNADNSIDKLIVDELGAIERSRSPLHRWYRRISLTAISLFILVWTAAWIPEVPALLGTTQTTLWLLACVPVVLYAVFSDTTRRRRRQVEHPQDFRVAVLTALREEREKKYQETQEPNTPDESEPQAEPAQDESPSAKDEPKDETS